ncbi:SemiSWEET transporter [Candidatus Parcubacteria bacterium]|nr:SemiSWEET transporter [Candidatus Parcubacteria bacterium]
MTPVIGWLAGALTVVAFLPQLVKIIRTKKTRDISLPTFLVLSSSALLWTLYGLLRSDLSIAVTNAIILTFSAMIVTYKVRLDK